MPLKKLGPDRLIPRVLKDFLLSFFFLGGNLRIGRRFRTKNDGVEDHKKQYEETKKTFAQFHERKMKMKNLIEKERKGQRHAQVNMLRNYRIGDLPDIQIKNSDILKPLSELCFRYISFDFTKFLTYLKNSWQKTREIHLFINFCTFQRPYNFPNVFCFTCLQYCGQC